LAVSDKSVKEIAFLVGYADTRRLDTHFTRAERLTPIRFRLRVRRLPDINEPERSGAPAGVRERHPRQLP